MSRMIVIDDEFAFGEFVTKVATSVGFKAEAVVSVQAFRDSLNDPPPSVLVIDLHMPGVDGIELLGELADQKHPAKIVVMSGVDACTLRTARKFGEDLGLDIVGELQKPVRAAELKKLFASLRDSVELAALEVSGDQIDEERRHGHSAGG